MKDKIEPKYKTNFTLLKVDGVVIGINFLQDSLQKKKVNQLCHGPEYHFLLLLFSFLEKFARSFGPMNVDRGVAL